MLFDKKAKTCTEVLDSGLQLKVWGVQTSRKLLVEIVGDKDSYWKQWATINDYCLYIITSNENGGLTDAEKKYCNELSFLLGKEVKKMRSIYDDSASNGPDCRKILALERAILIIQEARLKKTGALKQQGAPFIFILV